MGDMPEGVNMEFITTAFKKCGLVQAMFLALLVATVIFTGLGVLWHLLIAVVTVCTFGVLLIIGVFSIHGFVYESWFIPLHYNLGLFLITACLLLVLVFKEEIHELIYC